jgi:hypothetical protein
VWTHRRFTWRYVPAKPADLVPLVREVAQVLGRICQETPQFYRDARIGGMSFGILEFSVTISDRDRWWVGRRARFLVDAIRRETSLPLDLVSEEQAKLPVHMNRGKWHLKRARTRENHA